jgi:hypothetical protein
MKEYLVEVDRTESARFALTVPAVPGLLVLGDSTDDVLERVVGPGRRRWRTGIGAWSAGHGGSRRGLPR